MISFLMISLTPLVVLNFFEFVNIPRWTFWTIILITGFCAVFLAISIFSLAIADLKEKATQIEKLQKKIIAQDKLAFIGQLSAGIVHEIKNPLNFITNFAELGEHQIDKIYACMASFSERLDEDEKNNLDKILTNLNDNLEKIRQHGKKANSIITSMLGQTKNGVRKDFILTDINALLEEHFKLAYHAKRNQDPSFNIYMQMNFDKNLNEILLLPLEIGRVALNMLNNAFYAICEKKK